MYYFTKYDIHIYVHMSTHAYMYIRTYHDNSPSDRWCGADDGEVQEAHFIQSMNCFEIDVCLLFCVTHELYTTRTAYVR